jgi:hypothetical protein
MRSGTPSPREDRSGHAMVRGVTHVRVASSSGVTPFATSDATFSNAIVDISRATSCGVTQVLVAPRGLAGPKGLLLAILVGEELVLKF